MLKEAEEVPVSCPFPAASAIPALPSVKIPLEIATARMHAIIFPYFFRAMPSLLESLFTQTVKSFMNLTDYVQFDEILTKYLLF